MPNPDDPTRDEWDEPEFRRRRRPAPERPPVRRARPDDRPAPQRAERDDAARDPGQQRPRPRRQPGEQPPRRRPDASGDVPRPSDPRRSDPRRVPSRGAARPQDPRPQDPRPPDQRPPDQRPPEPRRAVPAEPDRRARARPAGQRRGEPRPAAPRGTEPRPVRRRPAPPATPAPLAGDDGFGQITDADDWARHGWTEDGWDGDSQQADWGDAPFDEQYPDEWDDPYGEYGGGGRRFIAMLIGAAVVIGVVVAAAVVFRDDVENFLNGGSTDFAGTGNGEEVLVVVEEGDTGADVARTLHEEGVTASFEAMYNLLLADGEAGFQPGTYALEGEMSAEAARTALLDPANKVADRLLIREGVPASEALQLASEYSGLPMSDFDAAASDLAALGIPSEAPSIEGYLFPATYEVQPGQSAQQIVQMMVDEMFERLDDAGVAPEDRHRILTMASIIQREAGSVTDDFFKVSRVFYNRLETDGFNLQSDATVSYGTGRTDSVFTTDEERADASNPYNTYANPGLPVGPIGLPGELAIDAAINPADGPWFYFVPINLETGETVFSETLDEHNVAVRQLQDWCHASDENNAYCE